MKEFTDMNMGIVEVAVSTDSDVLLLGYHQNGLNEVTEMVTKFSFDNGGTFKILKSTSSLPILVSEKGLLIGLINKTDPVYVVSRTQIRVYSIDDDTVEIYSRSATTVAASLTESFLLSVSLSATDTTISAYDLNSDFSAPAFASSFPQDHGGSA